MDISKILDFHRMVMMSAQHHEKEDETSCGPLCQHPACWDSNRRRERGIPRQKTEETDDEDEESDLPTLKMYNMLEDYGESGKDRYPARYGGRALHDRSSSMRNLSQPLRSDSFGMTTAPFATPVSPEKGSRSHNAGLRVVEVQEVFDKDDLNSRWDETFMTRQYLVWVPNPQRKPYKHQLAITNRPEGEKDSPKVLLTRDLTESMVPLQIKQEREETIVDYIVKRQNRSRSPIFTKGSYPKTPHTGSKPDIDAEGVRELLSLPREVLVQVLDRTKESDFVSREKIHNIIEEVLESFRERRSANTARDFSPPRPGELDTSDVLMQQKIALHDNKHRNLRDAHLMEQRPIFQLDDDKSSIDTARDLSDASSTQGHVVKDPRFPGYKKPLPAITADDCTPMETPRRRAQLNKEKKKIPSISLGLPELPSGIRQTRAFVYNSKHKPDFTLVPVPTPPESSRSSESLASGHGTTLHVNLPSITDNRDTDYYAQPGMTRSTTDTADDGAMHLVSPALSTRVPKAPAGTPATFQSPTKSLMFRDITTASSVQVGDGRGLPPSREITMSPGHKFWVAGSTTPGPGQAAPSPDELGTIEETAREMANSSNRSPQEQPSARNVQFSEPPPQRPTSPLTQAPTEGQTGSPEEWPQVTEPTFDTAAGIMGSRSETNFITSTSLLVENGSALQRSRSDLSSRGSERSTLARRILDEGGKGESPAPPPPSPEPKEFGDRSGYRGGKRESKSRESNTANAAAMEPLMEQSESEGSVSPTKKLQSDKTFDKPSAQGQSGEPAIQEEVTQSTPQLAQDVSLTSEQFDPVSKVMVSHVAPRPTGSREKLQQTFINVDIPAEDMSSVQAELGSTPPDFTPSVTASPGKNSPAKLSTPKSSAGPSSPVKKNSSSRTPSPRKSQVKKNGKKNGRGRKDSGEDQTASTSDETG